VVLAARDEKSTWAVCVVAHDVIDRRPDAGRVRITAPGQLKTNGAFRIRGDLPPLAATQNKELNSDHAPGGPPLRARCCFWRHSRVFTPECPMSKNPSPSQSRINNPATDVFLGRALAAAVATSHTTTARTPRNEHAA